ISGTASVTVTMGTLATITVTPNPDTLNSNATQLFAAVGKDAGGNILPISPVWSVVANGGSIAPNGLFTAGGAGGTFPNTVKANSGSISGFATVVVNPVIVPPLVVLDQNGIMAGTAFTCITGGIINADISISPGSTVTGFPPCVITGVQHLADAVALQAQNNLTTAYNTLAGLPCPPANAIVGNLGGTTKPAGVYCTAIGIGVTGTLTLDGGGDPNANFVFQAGSSLITAGDIVLINGAQAKNVYWQVGSSATLGTNSHIIGSVLAFTSITATTGATIDGRLLARNGAVTLDHNTITTETCASTTTPGGQGSATTTPGAGAKGAGSAKATAGGSKGVGSGLSASSLSRGTALGAPGTPGPNGLALTGFNPRLPLLVGGLLLGSGTLLLRVSSRRRASR
ncbi:MAG TPA: ice-binding family protein, partial [Actinomycetota bacterium]|nr:ice-binding family protein [Actinomycetota bacterium]